MSSTTIDTRAAQTSRWTRTTEDKRRAILNGILWVIRNDAQWKDMPDRYPSYQICYRRFQEWVKAGAFEKILKALECDLKECGDLDLSECFVNGTIVIAKEGGWCGKIQDWKNQ